MAFQPQKSPVYMLLTLAADDDELIPPKKNGGPLPKDEIERVRLWIKQGAVWPDGLAPLRQREAGQHDRPPNPDNLELVKKLHAAIIAKAAGKSEADMREYQNTVPRTGARYTMVPIKGGDFLMGSPQNEAGRQADEAPQVKVKISPFWMGKIEVTWDEYLTFHVAPVIVKRTGPGKRPARTSQNSMW